MVSSADGTFAEGSVLKTIEGYAFVLTGLASVASPASPAQTSIGSNAFRKCGSLTAITFADGSVLKSIEGYAFKETGLASVDFPATLKSIGPGAFSECTSLTNVTFNGSTCYGPDVIVDPSSAFDDSPVDPEPEPCPSR